MAIIRDEKGNIYNIPDSELKKYLVSTVPAQKGNQPESLCLDPKVDIPLGPHDGWSYVKTESLPIAAKKTSARSRKAVPVKNVTAKKTKSKKGG
ncbi:MULTISPECIES: hypothetical protein [Burkholderia]|uniref:hypothetical protein n=1 Tax=Burkholderia TaxID=32008 RepID=UPI0013C401EC|nr:MULTISPECIES: hypothetical protein [Burkholderia]